MHKKWLLNIGFHNFGNWNVPFFELTADNIFYEALNQHSIH